MITSFAAHGVRRVALEDGDSCTAATGHRRNRTLVLRALDGKGNCGETTLYLAAGDEIDPDDTILDLAEQFAELADRIRESREPSGPVDGGGIAVQDWVDRQMATWRAKG